MIEGFNSLKETEASKIAEVRKKYGDREVFFYFNNFYLYLPGGGSREMGEAPFWDETIWDKQGKNSVKKQAQTPRQFFETINQVIEELNINPQELIEANKIHQGLPDDKRDFGPHINLLIPIYLRLVEIGYNAVDLQS